MKGNKNLEEEINLFLYDWGYEQIVAFLQDVIPLFELYNVNEDDDWVQDELGRDENYTTTVRIIRTVYLMSKIATNHSGRLCSLNAKYRDLWKKMEKEKKQVVYLTVNDVAAQ